MTLPAYNPTKLKTKKILYNKYNFGNVSQMVYMPNGLMPSASGKIVKVRHYLAVELLYTGFRYNFPNPIVRIPVQVYTPPFKLESSIQAPSNWNPKLMPTTNFSLELGSHGDPNSQEESRLLGKMPARGNFM